MAPLKVSGDYLNLTPVWRVTPTSVSMDPWRKVTGAVLANGSWLFPAYFPAGLSVFHDLRVLAPHLEWDKSALDILRGLKGTDDFWTTAKNDYLAGKAIVLPEALSFPSNFAPYHHQRMGIARIASWWRSFFLWEMGTGKTRTMIDGYRLSRRENPKLERMLVLAPPVVLPTWVNEVRRCSQDEMTAVIWDGSDKSYEKAQTADVVVLSYARARLEFDPKNTHPKRLKDLNYQVIVADESHSIGNYESAQTQAALSLSAKACRRYLLSGTAADHPGKLYAQLRFLSPALMPMKWHEYKEAHFVYSKFNKHQVFGYKRLDDLNSRVEGISTRMKKKECIDLPPVTFIDVPFDLRSDQVDQYDACIARLKDFELYQEKLKGQGVSVAHGGALVNKLLQIVSGFVLEGADPLICDGCDHLQQCVPAKVKPYTDACHFYKVKPETFIKKLSNPKLNMFSDLLENILSDDDSNKVIVWGTYLEELNAIQSAVEKLKYGFVRVDGSSTNQIEELSSRFQNDPACRVYIGQVSSGVGVTLTAANYMIYYALTWNLTHYKQSLERNNRPGQTRNMVVYRLLSTHPMALDSFLAKMLAFKDNVAYTMLERITCASCDRMADCAKAEIKPFRKGCKFSAEVSKPVATTQYLNLRRRDEDNTDPG